jgi:hypothetical protein
VIPKRRLLATVVVALTFGPVSAASADDEAPDVRTNDVTSIGGTTARFNGVVDPNDRDTTVWFEYGTTTAYGSTSSSRVLDGDGDLTVFHPASALTPGTLYHVRLRATNSKGSRAGADRTFTTARAAPASGGTTPPGATPALPGTPAVLPVAPPEPQIGDSVVVAPSAGTVLVKAAGAAGFVALEAGDAIPVGSVVDTRQGTVKLTSAVPGGRTQTGEFRGALFQVRQTSGGDGMTDIVLRGAELNRCGRAAARAAARGRKPPVRRLWSSDSGGRFRTHGRNSVATVRGTKWVTTETCAGTRTTVTEGAVSVRDLRLKRTVLVRSGHSYLARAAR